VYYDQQPQPGSGSWAVQIRAHTEHGVGAVLLYAVDNVLGLRNLIG